MKDSVPDKHSGKRKDDEALSLGTMKDSPNMFKGLTQYPILEKLTCQTKIERYEVRWKEGLKMTGQKLNGRS